MNCEQTKPLLLDYLLEETSAKARRDMPCTWNLCNVLGRGWQAAPDDFNGRISRAEGRNSAAVPIGAEPANWWTAFWHNTAQLSFATSGMACLAVALLAVFQTQFSYEQGNFNLAFGAAPAVAQPEATTAIQAVNGSGSVDRAAILELIAQEVAVSEARLKEETNISIQTVAQRADQQRRSDLQEIAESLRYFQSTQTVMWKEQVQSQHVGQHLAATRWDYFGATLSKS